MKFGIAKNVRSEVRECTPELLNRVLDSAHVARICAEIEDALETHQRGELTKDEYENLHDYLYEPYLAEGGNGTAKKVMSEVERLPLHE